MKAKHTFFILMMSLGALTLVKAQDTTTMDLRACMRYAVEHSTKMRIAQADNRDAQIDRRDAILATAMHRLTAAMLFLRPSRLRLKEALTPIPTLAAALTLRPTPILGRPHSTTATASRRASTSSTDSRPSTT